ncbi:hypothetical protein SAMN05421647_10668 [Marinobacterium stanieri]|uniref:Uncharacterized protein n=1 Tax=Marinobacterium stanieri TaxID=49186 RepID=A0A1N6TXB9_9GAMM|nr:hypothetical protein SAMN05421647_10668 [Marinobacterium stanieri]
MIRANQINALSEGKLSPIFCLIKAFFRLLLINKDLSPSFFLYRYFLLTTQDSMRVI